GCQRIIWRTGSELVSKPLQAQAGALCHTHHVPCIFDGMAERVNAASIVICGRLHVSEYNPRRSESARDRPWFNDSIPDGARCLISATCNDRRTLGETGRHGA